MKNSCHSRLCKFYSSETHLVVRNSTYTSECNCATDVRLGMQDACRFMVIHYHSENHHLGNVDYAMTREVVVITGNCVNTKQRELFLGRKSSSSSYDAGSSS